MKQLIFILLSLFIINKIYSQWALVDSITYDIRAIHYKSPCIIASKNSGTTKGIYISCDYSDSFTLSTYNGFSSYGISDISSFGDSIFCISNGILNLSTDIGTSWSILDTLSDCSRLFVYNNYLLSYRYDFFRYNILTTLIDTILLPNYNFPTARYIFDNDIYIATTTTAPPYPIGYLFKSSDNGLTWDIINNNSVPYNNSIVKLDNIIILTGQFGIYKSIDNGTSVNYITNAYGEGFHLLNLNGNILLSSYNGSYVSYDTALTWQSLNDGFTQTTSVFKIIQVEDYLYAATNKGLWKRPLSDIVGLKQVNESIENKATAYYYENQLHINTIGLNGKTQIIIYDIQGRELFNGYSYFSNLNGNKNILLNNLSKGIYFLRISNENLIISEKFVVQ